MAKNAGRSWCLLPSNRLYTRPVVGTLAPFAITTYFWVIWYLYLSPPNKDDIFVFGRPGGPAIYYSWFVLATLGLNISQYGLESVEKSLVHKNAWLPIGGVQIKEQYNHTWARPDGWFRVARRTIFRDERPIKRALTIWTMLTVITFFGFLGLPLSGLAMTFTSGYTASSGVAPSFVGYTNASWNARSMQDSIQRVLSEWTSKTPVLFPGAGVIYTASNVTRKTLPFLNTFPNRLLDNDAVSNLLLAPQANVPIQGETWGLNFGFECSVVRKLSEFTILSQRIGPVSPGSLPANTDGYCVLDRSAYISLWSVDFPSGAENVQAVTEIGYDFHAPRSLRAAGIPGEIDCYRPMPTGPGIPEPYPGLDQPQTFEMILWQNLRTDKRLKHQIQYNLSLADTIPELRGEYTYDATRNGTNETFPMEAIGVRCTSVSEVGTAQIDGRTGTFSNFVRSDYTSRPLNNVINCAKRLSTAVHFVLFWGHFTGVYEDSWLGNFYESVGKFAHAFGDPDAGDNLDVREFYLQSTYLQAIELQRSVSSAYALYALQLMYNSGVGYFDSNGSYVSSNFTDPAVTSYELGTLLVPGVVPPALVAVLLALWAIGSMMISLTYGFRRHET